jgi:hypothetical protein
MVNDITISMPALMVALAGHDVSSARGAFDGAKDALQHAVIAALHQGEPAKKLQHLSGLSQDEWNEIAPLEGQLP